MLTNYLKITLRNLLRQKSFSIINIAGLTIGLVTFLAISLYIVDELSFDRFHASLIELKSGSVFLPWRDLLALSSPG